MIFLNSISCDSILGRSDANVIQALANNQSDNLRSLSGYLPKGLSACLGRIEYDLPKINNAGYRNCRLLIDCISRLKISIEDLKSKYSPERIGIVVGTSTSAITDVENDILNLSQDDAFNFFYDFKMYEIGIISDFLKNYYGVTGPCFTVSTACTSSSKAIISAADLVQSGICDVVLACGTDSLSSVSVSGFYALGALSLEHCRPFASNRCGINISEGCGVTVVSKEMLCDDTIKLLGWGQTSDGYHISAPDPQGTQGINAVLAALHMAKLTPQDIGYVNMHGTGTKLNDSMEGCIIKAVFGKDTPVSSTKHLTGHALGAAAIVEAYIARLILQNNLTLPFHPYTTEEVAEEFSDINLLTKSGITPNSPYIMTNNFAFGGNNTSLILGK